MNRPAALVGSGVLLLGLSLAFVPATGASASSHKSKTTHHKAKRESSKHSSSSEFVKVGPLECPKSSIITSATGTTFKGPNSQNGGTAACIYLDQTGNELNVIYESPGESKSKWVATDPSNIGEPATSVPGLGEAAFDTTTFGHAEVDIYESSSKEVAITLDPYNGANVVPSELTEVIAVGRSVVRLPYPG
jgi:hypothetical protein